MTAPTFTPLPTTPNRESSPETFSADADAFLGALPTFQTEGNALGNFCQTKATQAEGFAAAASASAATLVSVVTTYTNVTAFNNATPADGEIAILVSP